MDPLLIDVPERLETERLIVRCPQPGDGPAVNAAVCESLAALALYMPWAQTAPSVDESEALCRRNQARVRLREDLSYWVFEQPVVASPNGWASRSKASCARTA